jgi:small GTP-binding protein
MSGKIKIAFIGEAAVRKTSIIQRYVNDVPPGSYSPTVSGTFLTKTIQYPSGEQILFIWDTAGQEIYRSVTPMFFRDSQIAIIVFDISNKKSFDKIKFWVREVKHQCDPLPIIHICGNKSDLENKRVIQLNEGEELAESLGVQYSETSAETGHGIQKMFERLLTQLNESELSSMTRMGQLDIMIEIPKKSGSGCC